MRRTMRRALTCAIVSSLALAAAVTGLPAASASAAATTRVITIGPSADLRRVMISLRPGDMLRLQPGTYNIRGTGAGIHPTLTAGTAAHPIIMTGADAKHMPLLQGSLFVENATYWTLQYLRVQGTISNRTGFYVAGGSHWTVRKSEFFGGSSTGTFANVAINNNSANATPTHWQFVDNCVHDGGHGTLKGHSPDTDHNLYLSASGNAPGLVARNVMYNATAGYNVKIGVGDGSQPAASNVSIVYNTFYNARRQVLLIGKATGDTIARNIMVRSTRPSLPSGIVFYNLTQARSATIANNYIYGANPSWYAYPSSGSKLVSDRGDDAVRKVNPSLAGGCSMVARNATVARSYGTHASGASAARVP